MKLLAKNRKAHFNYEFLDVKEAGMQLRGWQVKSIKTGNASITEAYAYIFKGEMFLKNTTIAEWPNMGDFERQYLGKDIKLLLKRDEIERWDSKLRQKQATTIVPVKLYEQRGLIKVEVALARGVKKYDKRSKIKERDQKRDIERELKQNKYF